MDATYAVMATNETFGCQFNNIPDFPIIKLVIILCSAVVIVDSVIVTSVIWRTSALHTNTNVLFASLTVSDILLCVAYITAGKLEIFGNKLLSNFLIGASIGVIQTSLMHLGAIAVDRYIHIAHPFYYMKKMTSGRISKILVCIWTVDLLYTFTPMLAFREDSSYEKCIFLHPPMAYYFVACTGYLVNIIAVFICHLKIACLAFHHKKAASARRLHNTDTNSTVLFRQNGRAALRSVKFFSITFGIFASCTLPPMVCCAINQFYTIPNFILLLMMCFVLINSVANVFIYVFTNKEFCKALVLTCSDIKQCCFKKDY